MSKPISLLILKHGTSFKKIYHKNLGPGDLAKESSSMWSHPDIMRSWYVKLDAGLKESETTLEYILEGPYGFTSRCMPTTEYPHIRLEIIFEKPPGCSAFGQNPINKAIPDDMLYKNLRFIFDNPTVSFNAHNFSSSIAKSYGGDLDYTNLMIRSGVLPAQPWAMSSFRRIQNSVIADIKEMRAGTWKNPGFDGVVDQYLTDNYIAAAGIGGDTLTDHDFSTANLTNWKKLSYKTESFESEVMVRCISDAGEKTLAERAKENNICILEIFNENNKEISGVDAVAAVLKKGTDEIYLIHSGYGIDKQARALILAKNQLEAKGLKVKNPDKPYGWARESYESRLSKNTYLKAKNNGLV